MKTVLVLVALLTGPPTGLACNVTGNDAAITVVCESPATGKWFVAVINRAAGTVRRATGRRS